MSEQYDLLKSILLEKSVRTGTFTLASGKVSDLYVDCRMTALDPVGATLVGALGWKLVKEDILPRFPEVAAIGGMTMGADPISLAVGMTSAGRSGKEASGVHRAQGAEGPWTRPPH